MDLRYLEFLLSAYSWILSGFLLVTSLWIISNKITEIGFGPLKIVPSIHVKTLVSFVVLFGSFAWMMIALKAEIGKEFNVQIERQVRNPRDGHITSEEKEKWAAMWKEMPYSSKYPIFSQIRVDTHNEISNMIYGSRREKIDFSIVQRYLFWTILFLPLVALGLEYYVAVSQHGFSLTSVWAGSALVFISVGGPWFTGVNSHWTWLSGLILQISILGTSAPQ